MHTPTNVGFLSRVLLNNYIKVNTHMIKIQRIKKYKLKALQIISIHNYRH